MFCSSSVASVLAFTAWGGRGLRGQENSGSPPHWPEALSDDVSGEMVELKQLITLVRDNHDTAWWQPLSMQGRQNEKVT